MKVGNRLPQFTLTDQNGKPFSSHSLLGKKHLIMFYYPEDGVPISTQEACAFRDSYFDFVEHGFEVIAISTDSCTNHKVFEQQHNLPYRLLSDEDGSVRKLMEIPLTYLGVLPARVTLVVDKEGTIRRVFNTVFTASSHFKEAVKAVEGDLH